MYIPKERSTLSIRKKIVSTIERFAPLFNLSAEEINQARQFAIHRTLKHLPKMYQDHSEAVPGYSSIDRFFYFSPEDGLLNWMNLSGWDLDYDIEHEVGHHLHSIVNPQIAKNQRVYAKKGEWPKGDDQFHELVAEYPIMILGLIDFTDQFYQNCYKSLMKVYPKYGPDFLPELSRMSLEEALKRDLIVV